MFETILSQKWYHIARYESLISETIWSPKLTPLTVLDQRINALNDHSDEVNSKVIVAYGLVKEAMLLFVDLTSKSLSIILYYYNNFELPSLPPYLLVAT